MTNREQSERLDQLLDQLVNFRSDCGRGRQSWQNAHQLPWDEIDRAISRLSEVYHQMHIAEQEARAANLGLLSRH